VSDPSSIAPAASSHAGKDKQTKLVSIAAKLIFWLLVGLTLVVTGTQFGSQD